MHHQKNEDFQRHTGVMMVIGWVDVISSPLLKIICEELN